MPRATEIWHHAPARERFPGITAPGKTADAPCGRSWCDRLDRIVPAEYSRWHALGIRGIRIGMAIAVPALSFLLDPAFTMGVWYTGASLVAGTVVHIGSLGNLPMPTLRYGHGGYVVTNSPLTLSETGITLGPFAQVGYGATEATIQHELAHVDQYNRMGGWRYMSHTWSSPFGGAAWAENNADLMAGTNAYGGNPYWAYAFLERTRSMSPSEVLLEYTLWEAHVWLP